MFITIAVIAYNEENTIKNILDDISRQDYDHNLMEVVLVDSASTDGTKAVMQKFADENKMGARQIVVLDNPKKTLPCGWNVLLDNYTGEAVIRVDAHAHIPEDFVSKNVEEFRFACGKKMGERDRAEVDCACGIPDSGIGMALGYAAGKGVPYQRAISKYTPTWPRSFTPSNQEMRSLVAKMKLIANRDMLKDKRVLFCDDSIVRGTQLRDNTKILFDYGAKEVHMRIACPPLIYGCPFINFTSSKSDMELITRRLIKEFEGDENKNLEKYAQTGSPEYQRMVDTIAERLNLSSLKFNTLEDLIEAIGLPKCQVCTHCFDGSSRFTLEEDNTDE